MLNCRLRLVVVVVFIAACVTTQAAPLEVLGGGKSRLYLDVDTALVAANKLEAPLADFERCYRKMTGVMLPTTMKRVAAFDPSSPTGLRLQATVLSLEDRSAISGENGTVSLVLTPTQRLERGALAGPGEKVVWSCTWQRGGAGKLQYQLIVANQPYQGPGYGPYTFATLESPVPAWTNGQTLQLALELRHSGGQDVRGGYRLGSGEWVYTDWFDPMKAGADTREPGVSDKNGPQGWTANWPQAWAGKTAAYVTGYGAKSRECHQRLDDLTIASNGKTLFSEGFSAADATTGAALPQWRQGPEQGTATVEGGALLLAPAADAWNTVGLVAATSPAAPPAGAIPLRLRLLPKPPKADLFDAQFTQGWQMDASAQAITLSAHTRLGLQNALYALLDRWGCRWVMVGELGECIPRVTKLTVPTGTLAPKVYNNFSIDPSGTGSVYSEFYARNQASFLTWTTMQHYWLYALPPEKHFKDHPEWYSLIAGKRQPKQLCTSNPEVVAEMIKAAKAFLGGGENRVCFPMDPMDGTDFCQCDNCRALDVPGRFTNGAPCVTDRVLHFVNQVAAGIRDEFPDRYVGFYAYWTHADLPLREQPAPNVIIGLTRMNNCLLHLTPTKGCPTSDFHQMVRGWQKLTPKVTAYEYDPISWTGGLPCPTWLEMGRELHTLLVDMGVKGSYSDMGVLAAAHAGTFLNRYLPLRMKVNPNQKPEAVLHDMCGAFFGPAAAPMETHFLEMAKVTAQLHPGLGSIGCGTTYYHRLFTPEQIKRARVALDKAAAAAQGQSPYADRVAMVDLAQQYLEGYLGGVWAAQAKDYDRSIRSFEAMNRALTALCDKGWADKTDAPARAKVMRLKALADNFPEKLGYPTQWKLLGPFDNSALLADRQRDPFEPLGNTSAPVKLADGTEAQWWDYRSPGGFLNAEAAVAPKKGNWTLSYVYAATTYTAERACPAQLRCDSFFPFRLFLNGVEVFYREGLNADCPDRMVVDVRLQPGPNLIVAKLCQTQITTDSFPWGLYLRVVPDDAPEVVTLPGEWQFRTDPEDRGVADKWFASALDDTAWKTIRVGQPWEAAIGPYDGFAWYRVRVQLPAQLPAGKLALQFGGVDEEAWVYVNGQYLGERTAKSTGRTIGEIWEEPFTLAVPRGTLPPGGQLTLAVRVHDSAFAGGMYRAVKLVVVP